MKNKRISFEIAKFTDNQSCHGTALTIQIKKYTSLSSNSPVN